MGISHNGRRFDGKLWVMEIFCGTLGSSFIFWRHSSKFRRNLTKTHPRINANILHMTERLHYTTKRWKYIHASHFTLPLFPIQIPSSLIKQYCILVIGCVFHFDRKYFHILITIISYTNDVSSS